MLTDAQCRAAKPREGIYRLKVLPPFLAVARSRG